jgi:uracil-DNA glycosylase
VNSSPYSRNNHNESQVLDQNKQTKIQKIMKFHLENHWAPYLQEEFKKPYMLELLKFLDSEIRSGKNIFPTEEKIFEAFRLTPLDKVKVVILGQDPYHGAGQAHGLSFSVQSGIKTPPSLVNIFKELKEDLGLDIHPHGNLESWAQQGVLLLNTVLTVEEGLAGSHHKKGWEKFTDKVIEVLNDQKTNLVFILWGSPAQKKASQVDQHKHLVLKSVHPSPLSVYRGFIGSKPFSQANVYLKNHGIKEIDWKLT